MARIEIPFDAALFGQPGITCETRAGNKVFEILSFKTLGLLRPIRAVIEVAGLPSLEAYTASGHSYSHNTDTKMQLVMYRDMQSNLRDVIRAKGLEGIPISMVCINLQTGQVIPELCETITPTQPETDTKPRKPGDYLSDPLGTIQNDCE